MRSAAPWAAPPPSADTAGLRLFNTLTRSKVPFVPSQQGRQVKWYICGPTVYDAAHMGHARAYITFDIVRRVLEGYFGYDVAYQMNITDIDDKIILRARQNYLFEQYKAQVGPSLTVAQWDELYARWQEFVETKVAKGAATDESAWQTTTTSTTFVQQLTDDAKLKMNVDAATTLHDTLVRIKDSIRAGNAVSAQQTEELLEAARDIVAPQLDAVAGATVTDHKIFRELTQHWEADFMKDMEQLNVRRPDVLTRVSEYVPKIVDYIDRIIKNGYGYESGGSVYFDVKAFDAKDNHHYAKCEPKAAFNAQLVEEGEGAISTGLSEKRAAWDFALWKASRPGEPVWPSPWSQGRPGWHIECSVMASDLFGDKLDIHSGGIDLAFPHHDNEMAQAEAYYECNQWVNYFLHAGHLHIEGQKMSKSLKNFITIKDALKDYTGRQMRILFLLHSWFAILDFKKDSMTAAIAVETTIKNFFANVQALARENNNDIAVGEHNMGSDELKLFHEIIGTQGRVHEAMCDSIDTPTVMNALLDLIKTVNTYINSRKKHNVAILLKAAGYVQRILTVFGVIERSDDFGFGSGGKGDTGTSAFEERVLPLLQTLASFRDSVRSLVREKKDPKELLALCDKLRDEDLPELGVRLEDRDGAKSLIKLDDRETLLRERDEKKQREAGRQKKRQEDQVKQEAKRLEKLERGRIKPKEMFSLGEYAGKFSLYDGQGIPTHDAAGQELSKNQRKKVEQAHAAQAKLHEEYLVSVGTASSQASSS